MGSPNWQISGGQTGYECSKSLQTSEGFGTLEARIVISERQGEMPGPKRVRRERTHDWEQIQQYTLWPEQELYEQLRTILLFGETAGERAKEIDVPQRTLAKPRRCV